MSARDLLDLAGLVPLLPLIGAAVLLLFGRRIGRPAAGWLATGLLGLAFLWSIVLLVAMLALPPSGRHQVSSVFTWISAGPFHVDIGFLADPLSITWCLLVTGVGTLIHLYAIGYMRHDPDFPRFFAYFNLFAASMLILVLADNYLLTFLGWEGVGLCSYLLIVFWYERPAAALGGKKAFVYNRVGDVGFLIAMFLLLSEFGSLSYDVTGKGAAHASSGVATGVALLLFLACTGKSAQIPLFPWLTDAMEGPTPVSALIHAATMVTAGVFLICRAHSFFEASADAMTVVLWVGAITALLAGTIAAVQPDIKRVLAYSTISQLGYMFLALGTGAYVAAVFQVITHAFFKGCLFLGAGSVLHGNAENQDLRIMGALRRFLPFTAAGMVVAWLSITGVPPFVGFWSKDGILESAFESQDYVVWFIGVLAAVMTGIYMTRLIFMTFYGNARYRSSDGAVAAAPAHGDIEAELGYDPDFAPTVAYGEAPRTPRLAGAEPHESPWPMVGPILVLALLAAIGGLLNLPFKSFQFLQDWLAPVFAGVDQPESSSFEEAAVLIAVVFVFAAAGILTAYFLYRRGLRTPADDPLPARLGPAADVLGDAYGYDATVSAGVDGPVRTGATFLDTQVDQRVIDGAVNGTGRLILLGGSALRRLQDGYVRRYAIGIALGAAALLLFLAVYVGN